MKICKVQEDTLNTVKLGKEDQFAAEGVVAKSPKTKNIENRIKRDGI